MKQRKHILILFALMIGLSLPALVIDEKVVAKGLCFLPEVIEIIKQNIK